MSYGFTKIPYADVLPEQILRYFGIDMDDSNKCICPFHADTQPSMQVNKEYVYCYGCKWAGDSWKLAKELLLKAGKDADNIGRWLRTTDFPSVTGRYTAPTKYIGPVHGSMIDYWHSTLLRTTDRLEALCADRLFTAETVKQFRLGWRPDKNAYVIPFLHRGVADIVQFRATNTNDSGKKYWGLEGHQHGSLVNRDILDREQDYVVILMGAFDAVLASQDGLPAVGMNGSFPFKQEEKERVQQIFSKQKIKFIVPDNNECEVKEAQKLAEWIGGDVRTFPEEFPHNLDYIDYRKLGKTVEDFKREVLGVLPYHDITDSPLFANLTALYDTGNHYGFADAHCHWYAKGVSYRDVAIALANHHVTSKPARRTLYNVKSKEDFEQAMMEGYYAAGGW